MIISEFLLRCLPEELPEQVLPFEGIIDFKNINDFLKKVSNNIEMERIQIRILRLPKADLFP